MCNSLHRKAFGPHVSPLDKSNPGSLGLYRVVGSADLERIADLALDNYERFEIASRTFARFEHWKQTFVMAEVNEHELNELLVSLHSERPIFDLPESELRRISLEANRRLLNYLSAAKTFLDHTCTLLKRQYGKTSNRSRAHARGAPARCAECQPLPSDSPRSEAAAH
jgi:hypothetical protein